MSKNSERTITPYELRLNRKFIKYKLPFERKNPNSLRFVIGLVIIAFHKGQQALAVDHFKKYSGKYSAGAKSKDFKHMNVKALSEIINDKDYAAYWHLEAIASSMPLPTGAFLLVTRLFSILRDDKVGGSVEGAVAFSNSLIAFANAMKELALSGEIEPEDFHKLIGSFEELYKFEEERKQKDDQPRLFD